MQYLVINADMYGAPAELGEYVNWSQPDEFDDAMFRDMLETDAATYAEENPHMIVMEVLPFAEGDTVSWNGTKTTIVAIEGVDAQGYIRCTVSQLDMMFRRSERTAAIRAEDVRAW